MAEVAFIFPGQGSQSVGMLKDLAKSYQEVRVRFEQASEVLQLDLWNIAQEDSHNQLNLTEITQPILLTASFACQEILTKQCNINPRVMCGHSLGEYSALCAANAIDFESAVRLVHMRGKIMQDAVPAGKGSMAAILGLADEDVISVCARIEGTVAAANFNAPGQVVIAGESEAVKLAIEAAKQSGAKRAVLLPVSVPSHCELMRPAAAQLGFYLDQIDWQIPEKMVIHNVDAKPHLSSVTEIKAILGSQLYKPVLWVSCIKALLAEDVSLCIEVGSGRVLTGLNKRIDKQLTTIPFDCPENIELIANSLESLS